MDLLQPKLTQTAEKVLRQRYLMKNEAGETVETPQNMFRRVAEYIAQAEAKWGHDPDIVWPQFYTSMARGDFLPNTPCLINAGRPHSQGQFSACFVLPVEDDMRSIFNTLGDMAMIHKSGGGTGFSFSHLRPHADFVRSTTGIASGPVSFMKCYDHVTECVKQSGARRGANMGILRVDHPDVRAFISCKQDLGEINNFNISIAITDAFMAARDAGKTYDIISPRTGLTVGNEDAREIWDLIVQRAHATGEPGMFFIDRANAVDPLSHLPGRRIEATNPCGEVPLAPYNACTLGSINLGNFYVEKDGTPTIDFDRLRLQVALGVRFLDDVLEQNTYPIPQIAEVTAATRKIGLGVMGWADLLVKLGIPYGSDKALALGIEVMHFVNTSAVKASEDLAEDRGPFPEWTDSKWHEQKLKPRRNSTVTVIAPTGSISIIAGCSSGIEPLFALCQVRNQADLKMVDFSPLFDQIAKREGFWSESVHTYVAENGTAAGCDEIPTEWQEVFSIANEIDPLMHVQMQSAFQKHTEDAVSKTINLRKSATVKNVEDAYEAAWQFGCKGITVYRDGCRENQTLSVGLKHIAQAAQFTRRRIPKDGRRRGETLSRKTAYGSVHVTINNHPADNEPFELFVAMGKGGSEIAAWSEALGRTISLLLSTNPEPKERLAELVEQLSGIGGGDSKGFGADRVVSAADGIARCIVSYLNPAGEQPSHTLDICPDCKKPALVRSSGCDLCTECGYSKC
jgi:ribonucleoside-diphosphate reductase alpha chain